MDQHHLLPCEENDGNGKLPKLPGEGQQARVGDTQQAKVKPTFHVGVQTQMEQTEEEKVPSVMVHMQQKTQSRRDGAQCVTVTVQQQWDERGEVPEVTVQVQQGQNMPSVTAEVQQEWNKGGGVLCVSVKVQQRTAGREMPWPCVTVQVQQKGQGGVIPNENVYWQPTKRYEDAPHAMQHQEQAQCKEGTMAEVEQQQDQEETNVIGSKPLQQGANDSMGNKGLLLQRRWDQSTEQLKPVQLLQRERKENRLEAIMLGKKLHDDSQHAEPTKMLNLHPWSARKEDSLDTTTEQLQEQENEDDIFSEEGAQKVIVEEKEHGCEEQTISKKHRRDMPNYFVAIPITNDQILDKVEDVQELIITKEPDLLRALIPVQTMHLTIIVAHLKTEDDVKRAVSALEHSKAKVQALLQGKFFSMTFRGIGQFNNQVIYVKMSENEHQMLRKIAAVESSFIKMNVDITGSKDFKPHLTFLKLSKAPTLRRKGFRRIHEDLYTKYEDSPFGTELLSQIDLCAMHKKKHDSGYYHCEYSIDVCPTKSEDKNEEQEADDPKENILDVPLNSGTFDNTKAKLGDDNLAD
ncbi:uncharacterized protein LOC133370213 isoform X2 [Rhineura floridana]|uniref:uncharacterized protein LOC133370213 isoform X2 n=1 Tax=Rhineura floridana TaxID=261503 RepID=UPI002AC82698|nr:uncharacterized protein LOC133370213 isoform X2 [Rhineura floridana]